MVPKKWSPAGIKRIRLLSMQVKELEALRKNPAEFSREWAHYRRTLDQMTKRGYSIDPAVKDRLKALEETAKKLSTRYR
jgi:hypothetical protein